ncbi:hypothetical protein HRI_000673300 [Hibiscus trionum]|uniref:Uncharacterized protein n=1 Tax=Hibiscus trionum TaxID=183268 RepID=A0A9W7LNU2_HIBTR|nr:hypothetical protein HRI_000673300 [Hibiscus trionum]
MYGLLGKKFKDTFGHVGDASLGGLVGLRKPVNHGVPYSLTEEFTSVYRMHQLLPYSLHLRNTNVAPGPNKSPPLLEEVPMPDLIGHKGENSLSQIGFTRQFVSMGHQACGGLELWNYPAWLRDLVPQEVDGKDRPDHVYLAALEIYRDRERKVARRRRNSMGCMPAIFSLFSKHHKRSKFISCGREQRKEAAHDEERLKDAKFPIRSPTLPVEMRVENRRHALVARLMGLDKFPPSPESTAGADKRVRLQQVGAVEKCDEELKAVQRIIEVVKTSISVGLGKNYELRRRRSPQQKHQLIKKAEEEYITTTTTATATATVTVTEACSFLDRFTKEPVAYAKSNNNEENDSVSGIRRNNTLSMIHSVDEVCKDIAWGERREIGIIGLALQQNICRDLIHELVKEIAS